MRSRSSVELPLSDGVTTRSQRSPKRTVMTGIYDVLDDYDLSSRPRPWRTSGL